MTKDRNIISVEVTTLIRVAPDEERERLALYFKGKPLARLMSMVDNVEAGNFYEGAKTFFKECTREEREAVGLGMAAIFEGIGDREVNKKAWAERPEGQKYVETIAGVIDGGALEYPRYALADTSKPTQEATLQAVLGESPTP